ncbi:phage major capsid protein [Salipiger sp. IMCC34102]|nr:phage major capsid protein [Salipiger sp. IMCC34102]
MVRSLTPEQLNGNRGAGALHRTVAVRNVDEEARTVEVAFSSEEPVERWFGFEVLDHSAQAVDLGRLRDGAAVLWNHNHDVQIGVVLSATIGGDRRGRATLKFGRSGRAAEIFQDILDEVIRHVSVGYRIKAIRTEEKDGEPDQVTVTEWEPFEISMVSVPADATVGVGRSAKDPAGNPPEAGPAPGGDSGASQTSAEPGARQQEGREFMERILRDAAGNLVRAKVDEDGKIVEVLEMLERAAETQALVRSGTEAERTRVAALLELGTQHGAVEDAQRAIRDNQSVSDFTRHLLDTHAERRGGEGARSGGTGALDDDAGVIGMSEAEAGRFSFLRALRALANPNDRRAQENAAFEREASAAAARASGREAQGIMVPADVLRRALNTGTSGATPGDTGGYAIATDLLSQSFIDMFRNRSVLLGMATPLGGLVGNVDIPTQTNGGQGYWLGEDQEAGESNIDLGNVQLSMKTVGAYSEMTRSFLKQTSIDGEALVRRDLAQSLALTLDYAGFYGTGSATMPLGLANLTGINAVPFAGVQPTYAELVQMESEIAADNADVDAMAYIGTSGFRGAMKTSQKFAGTNGAPVWEAGGTVNGYRAEITNQVQAGDVFFGNFADMLLGMWGGLDLTVDPYSESKRGRVAIVAFQDADIAYRHVESFCLGRQGV